MSKNNKIEITSIKKLKEHRISIKGRGKYGGRYQLSENGMSIIVFYANVEYKEHRTLKEFIWALEFNFLIEYICSCVLQGKKSEKLCTTTPNSKNKKGICIPAQIVCTIFDELGIEVVLK